MRTILVASLVLAACRTQGLSVTETSSELRRLPVTVQSMGCATLPATSFSEITSTPTRLTIDHYSGLPNLHDCRELSGQALVDRVANTLFVLFDPTSCVSPAQPSACEDSRLRFTIDDDLHDLQGDAWLSLTFGRDRPDFSNQAFVGVSFATGTNYKQYVPSVKQATLDGNVLTAHLAQPACSTVLPQILRERATGTALLVPYVTESPSCAGAPAANFFIAGNWTGPMALLSHEPGDAFRLVNATP